MDCVECREAIALYEAGGQRPPGLVRHAQDCPECMALLTRTLTNLLVAKRDAALMAAIDRGIAQARSSRLRSAGLEERENLFAQLRAWVESAGERLVGAIQHFDLSITPQFAGAMGEPGRVRVEEYKTDLSKFVDTGWEPESIIRIGPQSVELLLKPAAGSTDRSRLTPRVALYGQTGELVLPDVTQMSRPTPDGRHVFIVWQAQDDESVDRVFALPLSAEVWFTDRTSGAKH